MSNRRFRKSELYKIGYILGTVATNSASCSVTLVFLEILNTTKTESILNEEPETLKPLGLPLYRHNFQ